MTTQVQAQNQTANEVQLDAAFKRGHDDYFDNGWTTCPYDNASELGQAWTKGNLEARETLFLARYDF